MIVSTTVERSHRGLTGRWFWEVFWEHPHMHGRGGWTLTRRGARRKVRKAKRLGPDA